MSFKSVKLFGVFTALFLIVGFSVSLYERSISGLTELWRNSETFGQVLKISTLFLGGALLLVSTQTLYCRGRGRLDAAIHITAGLSLLLLFLTPFYWHTRTLYLYPYSYVKLNGTTVGLKELTFRNSTITGDFFIEEKKGGKAEGNVSFNRPLISREGFIWIRGISEFNGAPAVEVKFSSFSPVPLLFITLFGVFTILLGVRFLKTGGRDVHSYRGKGAPEADR